MVGALSFDTILDLCRNEHRRIVLAALADEQRSFTVDALTEAILEYNHRTPPAEASEEVITRIRRSLHHAHLPKLASAGVVDYDPERGLVDPTDDFVRGFPYLSAILDADPELERPVEL